MNQGSPVASRVRTPWSPFRKFPGHRPGPTSLNGGQLSSGLQGDCFSDSLVFVSAPFPSGSELAIFHDLGRSLVNLSFQVCRNNASGVPPQHIRPKRPKRRSGTLHRRPLTIGILFQCIPLWRWETRKEVDRSRWRPTHRLPLNLAGSASRMSPAIGYQNKRHGRELQETFPPDINVVAAVSHQYLATDPAHFMSGARGTLMRAWGEGTLLMQQGAHCSRGRFFASWTLATTCIWVSEGGKRTSRRENQTHLHLLCQPASSSAPPPPPSSAFSFRSSLHLFSPVARVVDLLAGPNCFPLLLSFTSHRQFYKHDTR